MNILDTYFIDHVNYYCNIFFVSWNNNRYMHHMQERFISNNPLICPRLTNEIKNYIITNKVISLVELSKLIETELNINNIDEICLYNVFLKELASQDTNMDLLFSPSFHNKTSYKQFLTRDNFLKYISVMEQITVGNLRDISYEKCKSYIVSIVTSIFINIVTQIKDRYVVIKRFYSGLKQKSGLDDVNYITTLLSAKNNIVNIMQYKIMPLFMKQVATFYRNVNDFSNFSDNQHKLLSYYLTHIEALSNINIDYDPKMTDKPFIANNSVLNFASYFNPKRNVFIDNVNKCLILGADRDVFSGKTDLTGLEDTDVSLVEPDNSISSIKKSADSNIKDLASLMDVKTNPQLKDNLTKKDHELKNLIMDTVKESSKEGKIAESDVNEIEKLLNTNNIFECIIKYIKVVGLDNLINSMNDKSAKMAVIFSLVDVLVLLAKNHKQSGSDSTNNVTINIFGSSPTEFNVNGQIVKVNSPKIIEENKTQKKITK